MAARQSFLATNNIDILLISESRFSNTSFLQIASYALYLTTYSDRCAHGGSAILIRKSIKHVQLQNDRTAEIHATSIEMYELTGKLTVTALYSPPRHNIKRLRIPISVLVQLNKMIILFGSNFGLLSTRILNVLNLTLSWPSCGKLR